MKELRVFVLATGDFNENIGDWDIQDWSAAKQLPDEAKDFINEAEEQGRVYSLDGFQYAFNSEEINSFDDFIFITNKY